MKSSKPVAFRLPNQLVSRLDRHSRRMGRQTHGVRFTRSDAVIALLTAALDHAEGVTTFECEGCGETFVLETPHGGKDGGSMKEAIWEQATGGGEIFCHDCFLETPACGKCGERSSSMLGDVCGSCWGSIAP